MFLCTLFEIQLHKLFFESLAGQIFLFAIVADLPQSFCEVEVQLAIALEIATYFTYALLDIRQFSGKVDDAAVDWMR